MALPIEVGPNPNTIATIGTIIALGDVGYLGTIGTLQSGGGGGSSAYIGTIAFVGTIGTLQSGGGGGGSTTYLGTLASLGTVGTIISRQVTSSISAGQLSDVGTIGTILSPLGLTATITSPVIALQAYLRSTIVANTTVSGSLTFGASTLTCATLQDMVLDVIYGTTISGSILTSVVGVEPTRSIQTGTLSQGVWYAGTVQGAERIIALGPLGELVAVKYAYGSNSTVMGVTITAEQSTTG